jgi:hypothetical protein
LLGFLLGFAHAGRSVLFQKLLMSHSAADTGSRIKIEVTPPALFDQATFVGPESFGNKSGSLAM